MFENREISTLGLLWQLGPEMLTPSLRGNAQRMPNHGHDYYINVNQHRSPRSV